jgi:hypothetical protein
MDVNVDVKASTKVFFVVVYPGSLVAGYFTHGLMVRKVFEFNPFFYYYSDIRSDA